MKLISCRSQWLDGPDLEIGSFDYVADLRDKEAWFLFCIMPLRTLNYSVVSSSVVNEKSHTHTHTVSAFELFYRRELCLDLFLLHEDIDRPEVSPTWSVQGGGSRA